MQITDLLAPEAVLPLLRVHTKKQLIHELAARGGQLSGLPESRIFETLFEREKLGSTGLGQGIAIPHGRFAGLSRMIGLFARVEPRVEFDAIDERPVDLVFALLAPEDAGADYLKALARISRLLRSQPTCEKLRAAPSGEVLYALLTENMNGQGAQAA